MDSLPVEMIEHILQFLDAKSLLRVSYVCRVLKIVATDQLQWIKLCLTDPACQPLVRAAMLKEALLSRELDAKSLYTSIMERDKAKITDLLFSNLEVREFALYAPFYENTIPQFFPRAVYPVRKLYLTEAAARVNTSNAAKVKHWLRVQISLDKESFEGLYDKQEVHSVDSVKSMPIIPSQKCAFVAADEPSLETKLQLIS